MTGTTPESDPNRTRFRDRDVTDVVTFVLFWGWIVVSLAVGPTWLGYWWVGVPLALVALAIGVHVARTSRYPVYVVGTRRAETVEPITESGHDCAVCGEPAGGGERHRNERRQVVVGITTSVAVEETTDYCRTCAPDGAGGIDDGRETGR